MSLSIWEWLEEWAKSKGGWAHVSAAAWAIGVTGFASVPEFRGLVMSVYSAIPVWLHDTLAGIVPLVLWYKSTEKVAN